MLKLMVGREQAVVVFDFDILLGTERRRNYSRQEV